MKSMLIGIVSGVIIAFILGLIFLMHSEESTAIGFLIFGGVVGGLIGGYPIISALFKSITAAFQRMNTIRLEKRALKQADDEEHRRDPERIRQIRAKKITYFVICTIIVFAGIAYVIWKASAMGAK